MGQHFKLHSWRGTCLLPRGSEQRDVQSQVPTVQGIGIGKCDKKKNVHSSSLQVLCCSNGFGALQTFHSTFQEGNWNTGPSVWLSHFLSLSLPQDLSKCSSPVTKHTAFSLPRNVSIVWLYFLLRIHRSDVSSHRFFPRPPPWLSQTWIPCSRIQIATFNVAIALRNVETDGGDDKQKLEREKDSWTDSFLDHTAGKKATEVGRI